MTNKYNFDEIRNRLKGYIVYVRIDDEFLKIINNFLMRLGIENPFEVGDIISFDDYAFYFSSEEEIRQIPKTALIECSIKIGSECWLSKERRLRYENGVLMQRDPELWNQQDLEKDIKEIEDYAREHPEGWQKYVIRGGEIRWHKDVLIIGFREENDKVTSLDKMPRTSALHFLRFINLFRTRQHVDEFIDLGLTGTPATYYKRFPEIVKSFEKFLKERKPEYIKEFEREKKIMEKAPVEKFMELGDIYTIFDILTNYTFQLIPQTGGILDLYKNANYFYNEPELKIKGTVFKEFFPEIDPKNIKHLQDLTKKDVIRLLRIFNSFRRKEIVDKFLTDIGDFENIYDMFSLFVGYIFYEYEDANYFLDEPELSTKFPSWQIVKFGKKTSTLNT